MKIALRSASLSLLLLAPWLFAEKKWFDIPWSKQTQAWGCGHNSVRMILGHWGDRVDLPSLVLLTGPRGTDARQWKTVLARRFPDYEMNEISKDFAGIKAAIDRNEPVLCSVNAGELTYLDYGQAAGHFIVLVGYDDSSRKILLRDPNSAYVEEMDFDRLARAWSGEGRISMAVRKKGASPVAEVTPFSPEAKTYGAERKAETGFNLLAVVPSVHLAQWTFENADLGEGFRRSSLRDFKYHVRLGGLSFGHSVVRTSPFLVDHSQPLAGLALGFDFGRVKLLFSQEPSLAPDVLPQHRERIFSPKDFSSTRKIPGQGTGNLKLDVSGHLGVAPFESDRPVIGNGIVLSNVVGGRAGLRIGLSPAFGDLGVGFGLDQLTLASPEASSSALALGGDLTVGPFFGGLSAFKRDSDASGARAVGTAWSAGLDLDIQAFGFQALPLFVYAFQGIHFLGLTKAHLRFDSEAWALGNQNARDLYALRWSFEAPIDLVYLKAVWGVKQSYEDVVMSLTNARPRTEVGMTLVFNPFMPWAQMQVGYRYAWKQREAGHTLFLGLYFGTGS